MTAALVARRLHLARLRWRCRRGMLENDLVLARFLDTCADDLTEEDVTALAQFDALNEGIASVTPGGLVTARDRGETAIMIRFGGQATIAQVTLPYARVDPYPADVGPPRGRWTAASAEGQ